jgi:hypothetical protein
MTHEEATGPKISLSALGSLVFILLGSSSLWAQEEVNPVLRGEVKVGPAPLPGAMVVLHQVSDDFSGEIDSIRAQDDGAFQLTLPRLPGGGERSEVFFASVRYQGLLYFGQAINTPIQLDSLYLIQAYDTLSVPEGGAALPITARNLFLNKAEEGWEATDFFQIAQDRPGTLYSPSEGTTWEYPLPEGIQDFEVGQGDLAPEAVLLHDGLLSVYTPIPPGERFFLVRYKIPSDDFLVPMPGFTHRMEVFVRDSGPPATFSALTASTPVELEPGNVYNRFVGDSIQDSSIEASVVPEPFQFRAEWLGLLLAAILGGAGVFAYRRKGSRGTGEPSGKGPETREGLIQAIARLDEGFQGVQDPSEETRSEYSARRLILASVTSSSIRSR